MAKPKDVSAAHAADRGGTDRQDQGGSAEPGDHGQAGWTEPAGGTESPARRQANADQSRCHRGFDRRAAALQYVFSQLPADFPGTIVVVQHMPEGFTEMFARRLDETCAIAVKEAQSGDLLLAGRVLDLSRQPAPEGEAPAPGGCRGAER